MKRIYTIALLAIVVIIILVTVPRAQRKTVQRSQPSKTYTSIRQVDFKNFEYVLGNRLVRTRRGAGSWSNVELSVDAEGVVYGDLTADAVDDAVVVLNQRTSGLGSLSTFGVYAYTLNDGRPELLAEVILSGNYTGAVMEMKIQRGVLFVNHLITSNGRYSEYRRTRAFRWNGSEFEMTNDRPSNSGGGVRYFFQLFDCDDDCSAALNGLPVYDTEFREDSGVIDFTEALKDGRNQIKFTVNNEGGGIAYGIRVMKNDSVIFEKICGRAGQVGCDNNRTFPKGVAREFIYTIVK